MISVLLTILKVTGIVLLCILGVLLLLLLLVLFVPVRYRVNAKREAASEEPGSIKVNITWLLHSISATFQYPGEESFRVRILGIPVFRSGQETVKKEAPPKSGSQDKEAETADQNKQQEAAGSQKRNRIEKSLKTEIKETETKEAETKEAEIKETQTGESETQQEETAQEKEKPTIFGFFRKLIMLLKNIRYTIQRICDNIKHIVKEIRYYIEIIKSDRFERAWKVCSTELFSLIRSIAPKKLEAYVTVGTGDPASTAQILAVHGMLYPILGNHIFITPDFENPVIEGTFFMKGRITVWKALKTAIRIYFNKDLRKVIQLFKKEAA